MKKINSIQEALFFLCETIYRPVRRDSINVGTDLAETLRFARRNRFIHYLALDDRVNRLCDPRWSSIRDELRNEYQQYQKELHLGLQRTREILQDTPFIVIKTISSFPHLTHDIDILVPNRKILEEVSRDVETANRATPECLSIDINYQVNWGGAHAVSHQFIWENTRKHSWQGIDFLLPNSSLDCLIRIGHFPFEEAKIRLSELLYIYRESSLIEWKKLEDESLRMGWPRTFQTMAVLLDELHGDLFGERFLGSDSIIGPARIRNFPCKVPVRTLIRGVIEMRAWKKIYGARFLIKDWINDWLSN